MAAPLNLPPPSPRPRIAIIGGGIAGLCLTLGLLKHSHISVHIYEAAPTFSEFGAGVEIGPNAQTALKLISPLAEKAFTETTTPNLLPSHEKVFCDYIVGVGEHENHLLCAQPCSTGMQSMHRARFLEKLVQGIPKYVTHLNKRLISISSSSSFSSNSTSPSNPSPPRSSAGPITLHFADGTSETADAVIGAEGIRSVVREYVLGRELAEPVFANAVVFRNIRGMRDIVEKLGEEYAGKASILCGPKRGILSDRISAGQQANLAALIFEVPSWPHGTFHVPAQREELDALFEGWGERAQKLIELMDTPTLTKWAIYTHPITPTYISRSTSTSPSSSTPTSPHPLALIGDAAHAQSPFQGTGAGQAIEDALILSHALSLITPTPHPQNPLTTHSHPHTSLTTQITAAFLAYDTVRRPRGDRAVRTSVEAGELIGFKKDMVEKVGGMEGVGRELGGRMEWLWGEDVEGMVGEVEGVFREALGEERVGREYKEDGVV